MTADTGTDAFGRTMLPIKSRIITVGNSDGVLIPNHILDHYGFKVGDFVNIILQRREPTDEELERIDRRKTMRGQK